MLNFCQYPKLSETLKCCPTQYFCTVRQKKINKTVILLLSKKKTKKLLKHRRFPLWTFLVLWDKNISTENHGTPNIHKIFDIRTVLKHLRVPLSIILVLWDKKFASENRDLPPHAQKFSIPKINETIKRSPAKSFGTVTEKGFRQIRDTPIIQKEVDTWPFLKHRRVPLR